MKAGDLVVPLLDLRAQYGTLKTEMTEALIDFCDRQQFILGAEVADFETRMSQISGTAYAVGVSSGTDALLVALMAAQVGPGDEVITSSFSFGSTAEVIVRLGATPVFVDINLSTFHLDIEQTLSSVTPSTKAIIPVHLFGACVDLVPLVEAARDGNFILIEDAAQAVGYMDWASVGTGLMRCLSFFPSKTLGAYGDAGMVLTNDEVTASRLRMLRSHGVSTKYRYEVIGGNFRLDALQAAVLNVKLRYLQTWVNGRRSRAADYRELILQSDLDQIQLPHDSPSDTYHQFVIKVPERSLLKDFLKGEGIETAVYYPSPLHLQPCFEGLGYRAGDFPNAESCAEQVLALPIYPELTRRQQEHVVSSIARFYS